MRHEIIHFLIEQKALLFGEFTLKSGIQSPYFFNAGEFSTGKSIARLGKFYAHTALNALGEDAFEVVYGPAYKGIPLAVSTSIALAAEGQGVAWTFDRKEVKEHGEAGSFVGHRIVPGQRVLIVDDVFSTGATKHEALRKIKELEAEVVGIVIALDRMEGGIDSTTAFAEATGVPVFPLITLIDIIDHLTYYDDMKDSLEALQGHQKQFCS